ncbi:MAG: sigma-70 family RNA polymerase sigma factor [Planctomycetes bacterium]|nr:sigma-70 family RNA polymerase sigma factor [Planctomycetota bacterium]
MKTTSISLLLRVRQSDDNEAWDRFVRIYTPLLIEWAQGIGLAANDADDLVQDVLTVLLRELPNFEYDSDKSFRGWLRTIATNRGRDFLRRRNRGARAVAAEILDNKPSDNHDSFAEAEYTQHIVGRALELMQAEFAESTWRACWECVFNDRAAADVADQLGITVNAVYVAKSRVLRRLRQELKGLLD